MDELIERLEKDEEDVEAIIAKMDRKDVLPNSAGVEKLRQQAREIMLLKEDGLQKFSQGYMSACARAEAAEARCAELDEENKSLKIADAHHFDEYAELKAERDELRGRLEGARLACAKMEARHTDEIFEAAEKLVQAIRRIYPNADDEKVKRAALIAVDLELT